jgi:hypothetical protein
MGRSQVKPVAPPQPKASLVGDSIEVSYSRWLGRIGMSLATRRIALTTQLLILVLIVSFAGCSKSEKPSFRTFASPEDAGNGLMAAAETGDLNTALAVFGADSKEVIFSGDAVQDKATVGAFVAGYKEMHRWRKMPDGSQILLIGAENFAFPIPLKMNSGGQWYYDAAAGKEEILRRRVGRNELAVIDVCRTLADAQTDYYSRSRDDGSTSQYAPKFISDPGKQNGLYWESPEGRPRSPLGPLLVYATAEGYSAKPTSHAPFYGYYFRMLNGQGIHAQGGPKSYIVDGKMVGGFAFVAYPAEYGNSGVMTFIIDQDGVLLQKDLGKDTTGTASAMNEFDPDASWRRLQQ